MDEEPEGRMAENDGTAQDAVPETLIDFLTGAAIRDTPKNRLVQKVLRQLIETYGCDRSNIRTGYRPTLEGKRAAAVDIVIVRDGQEPADDSVERVIVGRHDPQAGSQGDARRRRRARRVTSTPRQPSLRYARERGSSRTGPEPITTRRPCPSAGPDRHAGCRRCGRLPGRERRPAARVSGESSRVPAHGRPGSGR